MTATLWNQPMELNGNMYLMGTWRFAHSARPAAAGKWTNWQLNPATLGIEMHLDPCDG